MDDHEDHGQDSSNVTALSFPLASAITSGGKRVKDPGRGRGKEKGGGGGVVSGGGGGSCLK